MHTLRVDPRRPAPDAIAQAAELLKRGGLVAFPTETVYGLGAHALDPAAVARIFTAKGRPSYNPLIVHLAEAGGAPRLAGTWPEVAERLAATFWPGPLTLVVPRASVVPDAVTAGLPSVALRVPAHPVAHALLREAGIPVAAPSANRSTQISPTTAAHVERSLGDRVDLILDGGPTPVGIESTVVSLTGGVPTILRPGSLSIDELRAVVGEVAVASAEPRGTAARPSPGMLDRHYAPRAEVRLFDSAERAEALRLAEELGRQGRQVGVLTLGPAVLAPDVVEMPRDARLYSARLYAVLHELDDRGCDPILIERVPDAPEWDGVRDRLHRAAHSG
ncbi:MAG TPA: L-threonylcarbamoyladenylate synthase [Longimicrobiaceae bacterium]|nr:L-threonylcarbamoyladenylate synthase [Longimicrobiaceae bacterium]